MKKWKAACFILVILLGASMYAYGEIDDSPGGQLLGLIVAIAGILGLLSTRKKL